MVPIRILMVDGQPVRPARISEEIRKFGDSYNDVTKEIIDRSRVLDKEGKIFLECASHLLSNFKMTRRGPFHAKSRDENLLRCWHLIGRDLMAINQSVLKSGLPRDRYLLKLEEAEREELIESIWSITKKLLPVTMSKTSYGLVGASKILFSVLPEIVLPVDNTEWLQVFKTVDLGDVLRNMVSDIREWEDMTKVNLNEQDPSRRLTTLPSVYNVMAMSARPNVVSSRPVS